MLRRALMVVIVLLVVSGSMLTAPLPAAAQDAPQAVLDALAALSAELGVNISLTSPSLFWSWNQQNFPDASLGCPQPGVLYPQVVTNGYVVQFNYNGQPYDYRVSADRTVLFRCTATSGAPGGQPSAGTAPPTIAPVPTAAPIPTVSASIPVGAVVCAGGLPTRLAVGIKARSIAEGSINVRRYPNLHDAPSVTGQLLPNGEFTITGGPQCATDRTWWEIDYNAPGGFVEGWVIEGDNVEYWLEPVDAVPPGVQPVAQPPAPVAGAPITRTNAILTNLAGQNPLPDMVSRVRFLPGLGQEALLLTPNGELALYSAVGLGRLSVTLGHGYNQILGMAVDDTGPNTFLLATLERDLEDPQTTVFYMVDLTRTPGITPGTATFSVAERYAYSLPLTPNSIEFSPDGTRIAISSGDPAGQSGAPNMVWLWDATVGRQLTSIPLSSAAGDLVFSPNNQLLAISLPSQAIHIWSLALNAEVALLPAPMGWRSEQTMAFSPDGTRLAAVGEDGLLRLWDTATWAPQQLFNVGDGVPLQFVAYNTGGDVLLTGTRIMYQDGIMRGLIALWDPATGAPLVYLAGHDDYLAGLSFYDEDRAIAGLSPTGTWTTWRAGS